MKENAFEALTVETLPARLGSIPEIADRLGGAPTDWEVREVGDGNLNLVFIVEGGSETPAEFAAVRAALEAAGPPS